MIYSSPIASMRRFLLYQRFDDYEFYIIMLTLLSLIFFLWDIVVVRSPCRGSHNGREWTGHCVSVNNE